MKRTKKVFTQFSEVAHLFANQIQGEARHASGNFYFNGDTIYSYGSHFPMAKHVQNDKGEHAVLFTNRTYSVSTSKHLNVVRNAINHKNVIHCELSKSRYSYYSADILDHTGNFNAWLEHIEAIAQKLVKARKPEIYLNQISVEFEQAKKYADFFGVAIPATLETAGNISNKKEYEEFETLRNQLQLEQERAERVKAKTDHKKMLNLWRTFQKQYYVNNPMQLRDGFDYLRYNTNAQRVQTSQGVEIPFEVGQKFYRLVKVVISKGGCINCDQKILNYSVKEINKNFIIVGCHKIALKEVEKLAKSLGW